MHAGLRIVIGLAATAILGIPAFNPAMVVLAWSMAPFLWIWHMLSTAVRRPGLADAPGSETTGPHEAPRRERRTALVPGVRSAAPRPAPAARPRTFM
jgi:hypothetical protein